MRKDAPATKGNDSAKASRERFLAWLKTTAIQAIAPNSRPQGTEEKNI